MTRNRALKQIIRDRAARTGERYTAARRNVLRLTPATPKKGLPPPAPTSPAARGGLSDAKTLEKTGHGLAHWFGVLDRFGAVEKGHSAAARHLCDAHKVGGWHAQGITVAYERARGVRAVNQRCDGEYEVSASKVIDATTAAIVRAITDKRRRKEWLIDADPALAAALTAALDSKASRGFIVRPDGLGRYRYKWGTTTVQFYVTPSPSGKMSVVVTNARLANAAAVEERRRMWRAALSALAASMRR